ncbi:hypothetical protein CRENBAI_009314 [Crenichthys baileyi]|uniref:Uncharacterized protein n=1 Tax=Crenichthys baileyi TaxID=28760 RepID=A0AAV9QMJ3_9TELE
MSRPPSTDCPDSGLSRSALMVVYPGRSSALFIKPCLCWIIASVGIFGFSELGPVFSRAKPELMSIVCYYNSQHALQPKGRGRRSSDVTVDYTRTRKTLHHCFFSRWRRGYHATEAHNILEKNVTRGFSFILLSGQTHEKLNELKGLPG